MSLVCTAASATPSAAVCACKKTTTILPSCVYCGQCHAGMCMQKNDKNTSFLMSVVHARKREYFNLLLCGGNRFLPPVGLQRWRWARKPRPVPRPLLRYVYSRKCQQYFVGCVNDHDTSMLMSVIFMEERDDTTSMGCVYERKRRFVCGTRQYFHVGVIFLGTCNDEYV
jgi:hypothetical protein